MWLTDMIGLFAENALYLSTLGYVFSKCGPTHGLSVLLIACWMSAGIGLIFSKKRKSFQILSILPILFLLWFGYGKSERILLIPPLIMSGMRMARDNWTVTYDNMTTEFKVGIGSYMVMTLLIALANFPESFFRESVPIFSGWLVMSILDLRLLRAETLLSDRKYRAWNLILLLSIMGFSAIMGSKLFVSSVMGIVKVIYAKVIAPILLFAVYILIGIPAYLLYLLIQWILSLTGDIEPPQVTPQSAMKGFAEMTGIEQAEESPFLKYLLLAVFIIAFSCLAFYVIRKMTEWKKEEKKEDENTLVRETIVLKRVKKDARKWFPTEAGDKIRNAYRQYLILCKNRSIPVDGSLASDEICGYSDFLGTDEERQELRKLWIQARYGEKNMTKEDSRRAKELVKLFQKSEAGVFAKEKKGIIFGRK